MPLLTSDRLLVAVILFGFGFAYSAVPILLQQVKDAARAPVPEPPPQGKTLQKESENSLKIDTLRTLANGYSYELRNSAFKIVASRVSRSRARDLLLRDLASRNGNRRQDAINAMKMLLTNTSLSGTIVNEFKDPDTITALVRALINVLPQHNRKAKQPEQEAEDPKRRPLPPSPVRPASRSPQETALLSLLGNILNRLTRRGFEYNAAMDALLQAGAVTRWLANYPFPCTLPENAGFNYKRSDVARLLDRAAWGGDDPLIADVISFIMQYPLGRKQMRQVGLFASSVRENVNVDHRDRDSWNWGSGWADADDSDDDEDHDVRMVNGEDTAGLLPVPDGLEVWREPAGRPTTRAGARLRSAERSQEEEHLRRRHREAIVVVERGAPLRMENILQRENSLSLPHNGVSDVEAALDGLRELSENRIEPAEEGELSHHGPVSEAEEVLDPVAEAEVERELEDLEARVAAEEEEERSRAQRRHREMEQLIDEDPEIQGANETTHRATEASVEPPVVASPARGADPST
ncbi:hypothetical protein H2200_001720 [Cladophialophora chaetospira]|uniref:Uncharacterized protein n=1 Tax=Cladophialophora chaetospira TaxID=386627 RepID=A0AA38XLP6_9EURO|nr:hypothetical protein H2200_001720 [Cladophialophora chaetospira]